VTDFALWFTEGMRHIADVRAYDHILFLVVLFSGFEVKDWKKLLLLITAFTIGHSITLALSVLEVVRIKTSLVEFLIPCTILVTALYNIYTLRKYEKRNIALNFMMALLFGLIHGLGFSILLRSLLGKTTKIAGPLFSFNLGIETGQLLIVAIICIITLIFIKIIRVQPKTWQFFLSAAAFGVALIMALERI
jgi:hypothetical protein